MIMERAVSNLYNPIHLVLRVAGISEGKWKWWGGVEVVDGAVGMTIYSNFNDSE